MGGICSIVKSSGPWNNAHQVTQQSRRCKTVEWQSGRNPKPTKSVKAFVWNRAREETREREIDLIQFGHASGTLTRLTRLWVGTAVGEESDDYSGQWIIRLWKEVWFECVTAGYSNELLWHILDLEWVILKHTTLRIVLWLSRWKLTMGNCDSVEDR